ncbi:MAG: ATP-binding protein [Bacteroidota bacterium]
MNKRFETAIQLLNKSLHPVPIELNELDWKSGLSENSERLAQHISAFANSPGGGYMAFGIGSKGQSIPLSQSEMDTIIQKLGNIARNNLAQPIGIEHSIADIKGNPLLFIYIPEHSDKPVHLRGSDVFESYKRSAGQTVKLSRHEVKQLISISTGYDFEEQVATHNLNSDEVLKLLDYDSYFSMQEKRLPDTKQGILQTLAADDLIKNANEGWDILNLGAILFARDLKQIKTLKRKTVRVIVYKESSRIYADKEQEEGGGYGSDFESLVKYIMDQLPTNEVIENALRKQMKVHPEKAIREFIANALIHQDFSVTGTGVMIEIFPERIEITNPGVPLVDTNRFIDTAPKSRNEILASLMRRLNICEERGSGIDRAIETIEKFQLPAPKFIRGDDYTRVILYAPMPLTRMNNEDKIRACYQHTCLHYVNNQPVNNQSVRKRFKIAKNNYTMASKILSDTVNAGLIKLSDPENVSKKFTSYAPFWA